LNVSPRSRSAKTLISSRTFLHSLFGSNCSTIRFPKKADTKMASQSIKTPPKCTADFCLIPIGTPTASVSAQIADVQRLMKTSGLSYSMHSAGTTVVSYLLPLTSLRPYPVIRFLILCWALICIKAFVDEQTYCMYTFYTLAHTNFPIFDDHHYSRARLSQTPLHPHIPNDSLLMSSP
jgi:hypothetical protein